MYVPFLKKVVNNGTLSTFDWSPRANNEHNHNRKHRERHTLTVQSPFTIESKHKTPSSIHSIFHCILINYQSLHHIKVLPAHKMAVHPLLQDCTEIAVAGQLVHMRLVLVVAASAVPASVVPPLAADRPLAVVEPADTPPVVLGLVPAAAADIDIPPAVVLAAGRPPEVAPAVVFAEFGKPQAELSVVVPLVSSAWRSQLVAETVGWSQAEWWSPRYCSPGVLAETWPQMPPNSNNK